MFQPICDLPSPFKIGLKPISHENGFFVDAGLPNYIRQKRALFATCFEDVFRAEDATLDAQGEAEHCIKNAVANAQLAAHELKLPPLARAALYVQDDLVIMRHGPTGWRLAAGCVCFPSSWDLGEKFGRPMQEIHAPVPMDEKTHARIERIFDALKPETPVWRENWSLDKNAELRQPKPETARKKIRYFDGTSVLRSEYQTLRKLPVSGDILFTIGVRNWPLSHIAIHPKKAHLLGQLRAQLDGFSKEELAYKGLQNPAELQAWLEQANTGHGETAP